jgi:membrane protein YqaA with SNARE-associated domain
MTMELGTAAWLGLRRLGGPGLILLGIADNSFIPMPGSMDVLTIVLAASHHGWWWYYAVMSTAGSVLGGYITYRIGRRGGKRYIEARFPKQRVEKVYDRFEHGGGFWAVCVPAILPPPIPFVPFLLAAGALDFPKRKFLAAVTTGRAIRYGLAAFLANIYGRQIMRFVVRYRDPIIWVFIAMIALGCLSGFILYRRQKRSQAEKMSPAEQAA